MSGSSTWSTRGWYSCTFPSVNRCSNLCDVVKPGGWIVLENLTHYRRLRESSIQYRETPLKTAAAFRQHMASQGVDLLSAATGSMTQVTLNLWARRCGFLAGIHVLFQASDADAPQEPRVRRGGLDGLGSRRLRGGFRFRAVAPAIGERLGEIYGPMAYRAPVMNYQFVSRREPDLQNSIRDFAAVADQGQMPIAHVKIIGCNRSEV